MQKRKHFPFLLHWLKFQLTGKWYKFCHTTLKPEILQRLNTQNRLIYYIIHTKGGGWSLSLIFTGTPSVACPMLTTAHVKQRKKKREINHITANLQAISSAKLCISYTYLYIKVLDNISKVIVSTWIISNFNEYQIF